MSESQALTASCLCRTVAWSVRGPLFNMTHCHCRMCRKAHAAPFATYVGSKASGFRFERGQDAIARYKSSASNARCFCGGCGSVVPAAPAGKSVYFPAGCLDDDDGRPEGPSIRPSLHLFTASKASWYTIADDLPQHAEYPAQWSMSAAVPERATAEIPDEEPRADHAFTGSCLCGRVAYAVAAGPAPSLYYCHCSRCRKARAAAHNANMFIERERFAWLRGEGELGSFKVPEAARYSQVFCRSCGSGMPIVRADRVVVPAGSVDTPLSPGELKHIFVASKAPWFEIRDDFAQWPKAPG